MTFESIMIWLTPYLPTITAVFSTIVLVVAGLGKVYSALSVFKKDSTKQLAALATQVKDQAVNNARLAADNEALMQKNDELAAKIDSLLKSDEFLANRQKADLTEIKQTAANMNEIYVRMLKVDPTLAAKETTDGTTDTNN